MTRLLAKARAGGLRVRERKNQGGYIYGSITALHTSGSSPEGREGEAAASSASSSSSSSSLHWLRAIVTSLLALAMVSGVLVAAHYVMIGAYRSSTTLSTTSSHAGMILLGNATRVGLDCEKKCERAFCAVYKERCGYMNPYACISGNAAGGCSGSPDTWKRSTACDACCKITSCGASKKCINCSESECEAFALSCGTENTFVATEGLAMGGCSPSPDVWLRTGSSCCNL
mmetsp:Transcript_1898/g.3584  ORF Transcript_1898/g.3584 Transcript_1898/m.3584 type:complete len:230 (-) Transcript_1898:133-822(-)